jgi:hypothetical protein
LLAKLDAGKGAGAATDGFLPDSKRILMNVHEYATNIYDAESGALITTIDGQRHGLAYSALSPDGQHVLTPNRDRTGFMHQFWGLADLTRFLNG